MPTKKPRPAAEGTDGAAPAAKRARKPAAVSADSPEPFAVVGIGASAGGLAAIEQFLEALPADESVNMALVLVQHLDPDHKSLLLDLIKRYTKINVSWAVNGVELCPGYAYIMPPNTDMTIEGGRLILAEPRAARGLRLPIDHFFRSLAIDQREHAICIVLSGTGSDGTLGVRAIKGEGGIAIAQEPESAGYDGMPSSAIATGLVDFVLAPADMPARLAELVGRSDTRGQHPVATGANAIAARLLDVLGLLRERTGHDFSHYKTSTMQRRVERRMAVMNVDTMEEYVEVLRSDSLEIETLFHDMLIGVTNFFRDPTAYEVLREQALAPLVTAHDTDDPIRVWVPGCSTGEEAYSIAMLLLEQIALTNRNLTIQVFATDLDIEAVEFARAGLYKAGIRSDVSPERLERFFVRDGDSYRVVKPVRDCLVFAKQDVTKDPPFSRVDLISCRNLLIYMDGDLQQRLMPLFHYALKPGGYLFLGTSETVGAADLFVAVDKKWKLFQRRGSVSPMQSLQTAMPPSSDAATARGNQPVQPLPLRLRVRDLAEKKLLEEHAPACVVINADGEVLYIHGHTGRYLEPPVGEPSSSLIKMARPGLKLELISGVRKVLAEKVSVRYERLRVAAEGRVALVDLIIEPMSGQDVGDGVLLVLFEDVPGSEEAGADQPASEPLTDREQRIADLDRELMVKEEYLRSVVEELETSNEELKSTNEEMQSTNEEMQSTNEELETSREELQSVNEELVTVNSELQQMIQELSRTNDDMNNMFAGTGIGTLFLDSQLRIRRFSPTVSAIMNVIPTDEGRSLSDISARLVGDTDLVAVATSVLDTLVPVEAEVETGEGRVYQMRAQPYRTIENVIEGAVFTFADITEKRRLQDQLDRVSDAAAGAGEFAQSVLDTIREPQLVLDGELVVVTANKAFLATFGLASADVVGHVVGEIDLGAWNSSELLDLLRGVLSKDQPLGEHQLILADQRNGQISINLNALELRQGPGKQRLILLTVTSSGGAT